MWHILLLDASGAPTTQVVITGAHTPFEAVRKMHHEMFEVWEYSWVTRLVDHANKLKQAEGIHEISYEHESAAKYIVTNLETCPAF